ncbi:MAG: DUF1559 domain-containing protein [Isosphaeraceae bacterium]|nr:DUF1559 domain-containing protein [Isosphaeraceae bacterium]
MRIVCWVIVASIPAIIVSQAVSGVLRAERKARCVTNLKELGLGLHNYESEHGHFPAAAIVGTAGKPLLSWRVELLPYLGERDLYEQFHRDEPWDSPHNLALISRMPAVYACPSEPDRTRGVTRYQGIVGPRAGLGVIGAMFEPARGIDIREITDGASNTVMVAEAGGPVVWTKPEDLRFEQDGLLPSFGSRHGTGCNALFADGSVRLLRFTIGPAVLRGILTRDGGEVLSA